MNAFLILDISVSDDSGHDGQYPDGYVGAPDADDDVREHFALLDRVAVPWASISFGIGQVAAFADLALVVKDDDMEPDEPAEPE